MMTICLIMFNIGSVSLNNMELEGDRKKKPFDTFHIFFFNSDLNTYVFIIGLLVIALIIE